jgi:hypothetical protein
MGFHTLAVCWRGWSMLERLADRHRGRRPSRTQRTARPSVE